MINLDQSIKYSNKAVDTNKIKSTPKLQIFFSIVEYSIVGGFNGSGYQNLEKEIARQRVFTGLNVTTVRGNNKIKVFRCKYGVL